MSADMAAEQSQPIQHHRKPTNSSYAHVDILQTLPIDSSPSCLEWSNDGQAFAITKANIYLLTPILGYVVPPEDPNTHKHSRPTENGTNLPDQPSTPSRSNPSSGTHETTAPTSYRPNIPFFMTNIEINKQLGVNWSAHSNDTSTITPPNDDRFWRTASWSPSGLSTVGSSACLKDLFHSSFRTKLYDYIFESSVLACRIVYHLRRLCVFAQSEFPKRIMGSCMLRSSLLSHIFIPRSEPFESLNLSEELFKFFYDFYPAIVGHQEDSGEPPDTSPETDWDTSEEAKERRSRFTSCVLRTQATSGLAWSPSFSHPNLEAFCSRQVDSMHDVDFSLLAVGHRRGDISLWRHTSNGEMELQSLNPICPNGHTINLLSWSHWKLSARRRVDDPSTHHYELTAYLAAANSKGVVFLLQVCRPFVRPTTPVSPIQWIEIQTIGIYQDPLNQSSITSLKWLPEYGNTPPRLVFSRLGEIVLVPGPSPIPTDSEQLVDCQLGSSLNSAQVIQLPVLQPHDDRLCWADCNSWATCSGIGIIPTRFLGSTQILVMLSNGLIFVLKESLHIDPSSTPSSSANSLELDLAHSVQLSLDFRAKFRSIGFSAHPPPNNIPITQQNVMSVFGSCVQSSLQHLLSDSLQLDSIDRIALSSGCIMSWLYEIDAPNKFRYKPENYQIVQFCLADCNPVGSTQQPDNPEPRTQVLEMLDVHTCAILPAMFTKSVSSILVSPTMKLLNIFNILHSIFSDPVLREAPFFDLRCSGISKLIDLLQVGSLEENLNQPSYSALSQHCHDEGSGRNSVGSDSSLALKSQLIRLIFFNDKIDNLRLKLNLCNFLLNRIDQVQFGTLRARLIKLKVALSRIIHSVVLKTIAQLFPSHQYEPSADERQVFNRYQYATRAIDRFPEPTLEQILEPDQVDHKLLDQDRLSTAPDLSLGDGTTAIPIGDDPEQCPACLQSVCFDSLRFAICRVGHVWDRCSVTFAILSTIKVRICTGCGRKSMMRGGVGGEDARGSRASPHYEADRPPLVPGMQQAPDMVPLPRKPTSWVQVLLESSVCCWHCGGRWRLSS
ncbi:hypothetical protein VP01_1919g7 [Puccinia sorghi]|uniref:Transcription factor IIIC putative zinc-finger domain-containing protein n=1 Tax=Puccinia sorghi TaxID=27349 RepID=A0A0L6VCK3_9BASI|nr:hypothetical protein VP01_1919g7 [Puccinia sorghi]